MLLLAHLAILLVKRLWRRIMSLKTSHANVYVLLYGDPVVTTLLGVFADLQDANEACLRHAAEAGVELVRDSPTSGPDSHHLVPVEPMRWDVADGLSCWVEEHSVKAKSCGP